MKISKYVSIALLAATIVPVASAQMMGGGRTMGRGSSSAMPDMQSMAMNAVKPVVAPDGTVLVTRYGTSSTSTISSEIDAVSAAGSILWKWTPAQTPTSIEVAKTLVVVTTMPGFGMTRPPTGTTDFKGTITALSLASGAVAWTLPLDGVAMGITPADAQLYAVVMKPSFSSTSGGGMMGGGMTNGGSMDIDTTLLAISFDGHVLWSLPLGD